MQYEHWDSAWQYSLCCCCCIPMSDCYPHSLNLRPPPSFLTQGLPFVWTPSTPPQPPSSPSPSYTPHTPSVPGEPFSSPPPRLTIAPLRRHNAASPSPQAFSPTPLLPFFLFSNQSACFFFEKKSSRLTRHKKRQVLKNWSKKRWLMVKRMKRFSKPPLPTHQHPPPTSKQTPHSPRAFLSLPLTSILARPRGKLIRGDCRIGVNRRAN